MKFSGIPLVAALAALCMGSCASSYETLLSSNDVDGKYEAAFKYYENGKYRKAAQLFESMSVLTSGTERDDTVQYYWGLSNYKYKDYYTAESNFASFVEVYPRSPFTEEARYLRVDCLYRQTLRYELDQSPSYTCITAIDEFTTDYPESRYLGDCLAMLKDLSDRLDRKSYEGARLYYKMEDYKASRVAFKNILKDDSENIYREDILYYIAMSSYKYAHLSVPEKQKERYMTFLDDYYNFAGEYPESQYSRELRVMYSRAQRALGRQVGDEELMEDAKDKDFERERRDAGYEKK